MNLRTIFPILLIMLTVCSCDKHSGKEDPDRLLTDDEMRISPDPNAPNEDADWSGWIYENNVPIRSLRSEKFDDLLFIKSHFEGKRIVQLGESGHGVREFNQAKTRLIKFLHEEVGFDVIAFESSVYECNIANTEMSHYSDAIDIMRNSIFGVWHTEEVEELFDYIMQTQSTPHPLILAGFDVQPSSATRAIKRPSEFRQLFMAIDSNYAESVYVRDSLFIQHMRQSDFQSYLIREKKQLLDFYDSIMVFIDQHSLELQQIDSSAFINLCRQTAWSMKQTIISWEASYSNLWFEALATRDRGMADNVDFLLNTLYPDKKIIVWAHNFHIRHNQPVVFGESYPIKSMGTWISERHREELYSVGLYMYRGQVAQNNRVVYSVTGSAIGSLESIFYRTQRKFSFLDLSAQQVYNDKISWMFTDISAKEWGVNPLRMKPKDQYDAILFIDTVNPPSYIPFQKVNGISMFDLPLGY